jgi:hypothetical protein
MDTLQSHYARLLGLDDSWRVESFDLQIEDRRVEISLSHVGSGVICPECGVWIRISNAGQIAGRPRSGAVGSEDHRGDVLPLAILGTGEKTQPRLKATSLCEDLGRVWRTGFLGEMVKGREP